MIEISKKALVKRTENFNRVIIEFFYPIAEKDEYIIKNNLLRRVLLENTQKYSTIDTFTKAKWDNYVLDFKVVEIDFENNYGICFYVEIPDKNFNYDEQRTLDFIVDSIYHPYLENGSFSEFNLTKAKNQLKLNIESGFKNVDSYANIQTNEIIDDDNFFRQIYKFKDDIDKVTKEELYDYYHELIETKKPLVMVFGNVSKKMENILNSYFYTKLESNLIDDNYFKPFKFYKLKEVEEQKDFNQSILNMVYKPLNYQKDDLIKMMAIKMILTAPVTHLLLEELRNKRQLVYSASSNISVYEGLLTINAKIKADKKDLSIETIKAIILKLQDVSYVKDALDKVVEFYEITMNFNQDSLSSAYLDFSHSCLNRYINSAETYKLLSKLKAQDLCDFVKNLQLDTIYFLKGVSND